MCGMNHSTRTTRQPHSVLADSFLWSTACSIGSWSHCLRSSPCLDAVVVAWRADVVVPQLLAFGTKV